MKGCLKNMIKVCLLIVVVFLGLMALVVALGPRGEKGPAEARGPRGEGPPSASPAPAAGAVAGAVAGPQVGERVEVTATRLFARREDLARSVASGGRPPGLRNGDDIFGTEVGAPATVLERDGEAARVRLDGGSWKGREAWVATAGIRTVPTEEESAADLGGVGIPLLARREIYRAYHAAGMAATAEADRRYPFKPSMTREDIANHKKVYEAAKARGRREILARFKIDGRTLDAIDAEGGEESWPTSW